MEAPSQTRPAQRCQPFWAFCCGQQWVNIFFKISMQYFLFIYLICNLNTCFFFSSPGPCMFSEASLGFCSTMYLFTAHPAARPLWQRRVVCRLGQGSVASGTEVAASPGSRTWLMKASHLSHSAPPNQVRQSRMGAKDFSICQSCLFYVVSHIK